MSAPLPPTDPVTEPWWEATREGRLLLQSCPACSRIQHPPRPVCTGCGSADLGWVEASGEGVVDACTVVMRAPGPGFDPPYTVARVRLAEGPLLLTNLTTAKSVPRGTPVRLAWRPLEDGRQLPVFEVVAIIG